MKTQVRKGRLVLGYLSVVFFSILFLALIYLSFRGFPMAFVSALEKRLQPEGLAVIIGGVKLNVFEGLVIENVRCFKRGEIGGPMVEIERAALRLRPGRARKGDRDVVEARIRNGSACLAAGQARETQGSPAELRLNNINLLIEIDHRENVIRVIELTADVLGMRLTGRGAAALPDGKDLKAAAARDEDSGGVSGEMLNRELMRHAIRSLEATAAENSVTVDIEFALDMNDVRNLDLNATLEARSRQSADQAPLAGTCRASIVMKGGTGTGSISMQNYVLRQIRVERAFGVFEFNNDELLLRKLDAIIGKGTFRGPLSGCASYSFRTGSCQGNVSTGFDPRALLAPLDARKSHAATVIRDFHFDGGPPSCEARFSGVTGDEWQFAMSGTASSERFRYKGVSNEFLNADLSASLSETGRVMTLAPVAVKTGGGNATADLRIDFVSETVEFQGVSTADPRRVATMIGPFLGRLADRFNFAGPVKATASGTAGYSSYAKNDIKVRVEGEKFGWNRFLCEEGSLNIGVLGAAVRVSDIRGRAYGGKFKADVSINAASGSDEMKYELEASVDEVDMALFMSALTAGDEHAYRGTCAATVSLQGLAGEGRGKSASGKGKAEIKDGHVFQMPLFGGLSSFMAKYVPGLRLILRQTDAVAEVIIEDGRICSEKILVDGDIFSLRGDGCYSLDGGLSFDARVSLFRQDTLAGGIMRFVTLPVSKMFEFHLGGTVSEPRWRPVYLPKEIFLMFGDDEDS